MNSGLQFHVFNQIYYTSTWENNKHQIQIDFTNMNKSIRMTKNDSNTYEITTYDNNS